MSEYYFSDKLLFKVSMLIFKLTDLSPFDLEIKFIFFVLDGDIQVSFSLFVLINPQWVCSVTEYLFDLKS